MNDREASEYQGSYGNKYMLINWKYGFCNIEPHKAVYSTICLSLNCILSIKFYHTVPRCEMRARAIGENDGAET